MRRKTSPPCRQTQPCVKRPGGASQGRALSSRARSLSLPPLSSRARSLSLSPAPFARVCTPRTRCKVIEVRPGSHHDSITII